jgi:hypothetical protein
VLHFDACQHLEQLAVQVTGGAGAERRYVELAWVRFGIRNEFGNGLDWERRMNLQDKGGADDSHDRHYVADEIVIEIIVQRHIDGVGQRDHEERVAVGRSTHDRFRSHMSASARSVLNNELLPESF